MKKAFTMAEVLIVMGIIGVISALVLPSLVNTYQKKVYATQLKKVYSQITTATGQVIADEQSADMIEGDTKTGFYRTSAGVKPGENSGPMYFLTNYFKTAKTGCQSGSSSPCVGDSYKSINDNSAGRMYNNCVQLNTGATICMEFDESRHISKIAVDVNGTKDPNKTGYDTFVMKVESDGSLSDFSSNPADCNQGAAGNKNASPDSNKISENDTVAKYAAGCLTKVISDGWKIEY